METHIEDRQLRKVTLLLPTDLIERAMKATNAGLTPTIRQGLEAIAASQVYEELLSLRGKVSFAPGFLEEARKD